MKRYIGGNYTMKRYIRSATEPNAELAELARISTNKRTCKTCKTCK